MVTGDHGTLDFPEDPVTLVAPELLPAFLEITRSDHLLNTKVASNQITLGLDELLSIVSVGRSVVYMQDVEVLLPAMKEVQCCH